MIILTAISLLFLNKYKKCSQNLHTGDKSNSILNFDIVLFIIIHSYVHWNVLSFTCTYKTHIHTAKILSFCKKT